ncbi:hypothetical protein [Kosmotoga sp. DU53]|uniref:hypothetical protein n=1 Tax=Kosmotoga sp. DU53 TaxID=1310160 RepID=UPI0007C49EEB|nr:hypothetical protein [Kosmotoga sp. DU53]MDK2954301.1 hypothetical protein [Kosmotoga sp.]OAA22551.1 hypothetical protein DU53_03965 [Kosmotoga sp. DU53]
MLLGFSRLKMEFPAGIEMAGYIMRKKPAIGSHDDLETFCIYLENNNYSMAIIVYDVLGIPDGFDNVSNKHDGVKVIPVATHTHAAPKPSLVINKLLDYREKLIEEAKEKLSPVKNIILRKSRMKGICDFRDRNDSTDIPVFLLEFCTENGKVSLLIFGCHPTVLGPENLLYSSDLAGGIRRGLEKLFGNPVVYLNSCCGNISTSRTRKSRTFEEVERLAGLFVKNLSWEESLELNTNDFEFNKYILKLPIEEKKIENLTIGERAKPGIELIKKRKLPPEIAQAKISILRFSGLSVVFLPFEMFFETCCKTKENVVIVNYANMYRPYLVPENIRGTYEWIVSPYPDEAENIVLEFLEKHT